MKTFNNEIVIHRGESFTIDKFIENIDGSPYIISKGLNNPYFLISVSDSKFDQKNRYVKNYWLDLSNFTRFLITKPVDLLSIKTTANGTESRYQAFPNEVPSGYVDGLAVVYDSPDDAIFYLTDINGKREYKCYKKDGDSITWLDYRCRLIKHFSTQDTENLHGQGYFYSIRLVSGIAAENSDGKPLSKFDNVVDILLPTKLSVLNNI